MRLSRKARLGKPGLMSPVITIFGNREAEHYFYTNTPT